MTDRLWNYLTAELDTPHSYLEIETENGVFEVEPSYSWDDSEIIDFVVYHNGHAATVRDEPDSWFWEVIEKYFFE